MLRKEHSLAMTAENSVIPAEAGIQFARVELDPDPGKARFILSLSKGRDDDI